MSDHQHTTHRTHQPSNLAHEDYAGNREIPPGTAQSILRGLDAGRVTLGVSSFTSADKLTQLMLLDREDRAAFLAIPDSAARDVIRQLATAPRWDGDLNSKHGRDILVGYGYAARLQGLNFLTQLGYAVVDSLWGLRKFVKE